MHLAARVVEVGPRIFAAVHDVRQDEGGSAAGGQALTGVPCDDINFLAPGAADPRLTVVGRPALAVLAADDQLPGPLSAQGKRPLQLLALLLLGAKPYRQNEALLPGRCR
jgi:hypothetical protein